MRASTVTQYGIPMNGQGRACAFDIGEVRVFLTGPDSDAIRYVAESLRSYWNADCEPEEGAPSSDFAGVEAVCRKLVAGAPVLSGEFSVGRWTLAVDDGFSWAVLDKTGSPLLLAHDSFEAALHFCRLAGGTMDTADDVGVPYRLATDAVLAENAQEERWASGGVR